MNKYNFNNLKNIVPVNTMAVVISILALFIAVSSGTTPCLSADSVCSSGVDPEYTNNLSVKAGTTNKATFTHNNLNGDNQYFFPESNYSRTSSVAILKKGSDQLNILDLQNGSIIVGQSQTTTVGALRVQTSTIPVLQLYGSAGWQDVGSSTNDISTVVSDSGTFNANQVGDSISIVGGTGITTSVTSDTLTIASSAGGAPMEYFAYDNTGGSKSNNDPISYDTEYYDTSNCFTVQGSTTYTFTYTCADTRVFSVLARMVVIDIATTDACGTIYLNVNSTSLGSNNACTDFDSTTGMYNDTVCLNQNDTIWFKGYYSNGNTGIIISGIGATNFQLAELVAFGTSQSCTNGRIN